MEDKEEWRLCLRNGCNTKFALPRYTSGFALTKLERAIERECAFDLYCMKCSIRRAQIVVSIASNPNPNP